MTDLTKLREQLIGARALCDAALASVDELIGRIRAVEEAEKEGPGPEPQKKSPPTLGSAHR